ncbi:MAG: DUF4917 family protein [Limnohabitans sp.]
MGAPLISRRQPGQLVAVGLKSLRGGWHADGGNLYLHVRGASRAWVFRYVGPDGKRKNMGLGPLHSVGLAEARRTAAQLREQLKHPLSPVDPLIAKRTQKQEAARQNRRSMDFKACAAAYIDAHRSEWKNAKHVQQWENTLSIYAYPVLGGLPVSSIDEALVLKVLLPIWQEKTETATRLRGRIESVMDWATFIKFRQGENPARWKGHLEHSLARPSKVAKVVHHAALPFQEIGTFMADLRQRQGVGPRAVEFLILTATRSGEVRSATWSEIDLDQKTWTIPAARMKMEREHRVALSDAAIELLDSMPRVDGLLDTIALRWSSGNYVPVFVSEGTSKQKLAAIRRSCYLTNVYEEVLSDLGENLIVYGWSFDERDQHLLDAIAKSRPKKMAVSVFTDQPDKDQQAICHLVLTAVNQSLPNTSVTFFDSRSPGCWNNPFTEG